MSKTNPYETPLRGGDANTRRAFTHGSLAIHLVGGVALIWRVAAWAEWLLIPALYPREGGPVPYLAFAPQAILLFLGCVAIVLIVPILALASRQRWAILYSLPAAAYLVYQAWRVI